MGKWVKSRSLSTADKAIALSAEVKSAKHKWLFIFQLLILASQAALTYYILTR